MDINTVAELVLKTTLTVLPVIAGKVTDGFLESMGSGLLKTLESKFQKNRDSRTALSYFLHSPNEKKAQDLFKKYLCEFLENDKEFRSQVENIVSVSNFSNASLVSHGDRNTIGQVASTIIDIRPDQNSTINFVLNINGLNDAISKLPTYIPPEQIPSASQYQYINFLNDVRNMLSQNKPEIETDITIITDLLKPAVAVERSDSEGYPNPSRFLQNVIDAVGQNLHRARIFDNFGVSNADAYKYEKMLPIPEFSQEFEKEKDRVYFVRKDKIDYGTGKVTGKKSPFPGILNRKKIQPEIPYNFAVTYNGWNVFSSWGEYHLQFALNKRSMYDSDFNPPENDTEKHVLTPDVIAKSLRAILGFYVRHMRYVSSTRDFFKKLDSR
jgi:hypothetical protein